MGRVYAAEYIDLAELNTTDGHGTSGVTGDMGETWVKIELSLQSEKDEKKDQVVASFLLEKTSCSSVNICNLIVLHSFFSFLVISKSKKSILRVFESHVIATGEDGFGA